MKLDKLGWVVAAGMAGAWFATGFQASSPKFANVDIEKVFSESNLTKSDNDRLQKFGSSRMNVLRFVAQNRAMQPKDAERYAELAIKTNPTAADTAEINRLAEEAATQSSAQKALATKANPTADDQKAMQDFSTRNSANADLQTKLTQQYEADIQKEQTSLRSEALDKVRQTITKYAEKQGYTIVFGVETAPYAANNLTPEILKEINKQ